jgi:hypothetical protein
MYYTTSGTFKKTKMVIDYANIILSAVIVLMFIAILFLRSASGKLFPSIFLVGALLNGLTCVKSFILKKKTKAILEIIITVLLLIAALFCWKVVC